jgi:TonB family protein
MTRVPGTGLRFKMATWIALAVLMSPATTLARGQTQGTTPKVGDHASTPVQNAIQILTPVSGVDFSQYVLKAMGAIRKRWFAAMPPAAYAGARGKTSVLFEIQSDGKIEHVELEGGSGVDSLDQAALQGIRDASPLDPLPNDFKGPYVQLRFVFSYNLKTSTPVAASPVACSAPAPDVAAPPPFDRLELVAFVTGGGDSRYIAEVICQRGITFLPEPAFLSALRIDGVPADLLSAIAATKPETIEELSPDRLRANGNLDSALAECNKRQYRSADEALARALKLANDSATLHLAYERVLMAEQKYPEAEAESRRSLEIWPEDAEAHVALALVLAVQKRDSEAVLEAREALRIFPSHKTALVELGMTLARSGQYKEAIPVLRQALQYAPEVPVIYKHLGGCLVHTGNFDEAIEELNLFLKTNPNDAEAHYFLGVALRGKGEKDGALVQFREAARLDPTNHIYSVDIEPDDAKQTEPAERNPAEPRPDDGFISDNVYTNTFFNFTYQFPSGWHALNADQGKAIVRFGGAFFADGDPIVQDATEAAARDAYQLLVAAKVGTKDISPRMKLIQVQALSTRFGPEVKSGGDFLKLGVQKLQHQSEGVSIVEALERFSVGGRSFWKVKLDIKVNNSVVHIVHAATVEKGYILFFAFATPDAATLDEIAGTIQSLRFTDSASH